MPSDMHINFSESVVKKTTMASNIHFLTHTELNNTSYNISVFFKLYKTAEQSHTFATHVKIISNQNNCLFFKSFVQLKKMHTAN